MADGMKENSIIIICTIVCLTVIICGILFWPTLYRYDKMSDGAKTVSVRINRITGATETFTFLGWKKAFNPKDYVPPERLPATEIAKLIGGESVISEIYQIGKSPLPNGYYVTIPDKNDFSFKTNIYNGTKYPISFLWVIIEAKIRNGTTRWKRKYKVSLNGQLQPFSSGLINVETSDALGVDAYIWTIDEAYTP